MAPWRTSECPCRQPLPRCSAVGKGPTARAHLDVLRVQRERVLAVVQRVAVVAYTHHWIPTRRTGQPRRGGMLTTSERNCLSPT